MQHDDQREVCSAISAWNVELVVSATCLVCIVTLLVASSVRRGNLYTFFEMARHSTQARAKAAFSKTIEHSAKGRSHWTLNKPFRGCGRPRHLVHLLDDGHCLFKAP